LPVFAVLLVSALMNCSGQNLAQLLYTCTVNDEYIRRDCFIEMPPFGDRHGRRRRSTANNTETPVFKYGNSGVAGDHSDDVLVHYWSAQDEAAHNASRDSQHERLHGVTADQQQLQRQLQHLMTSSVNESSVHSATFVLTIAGSRRRTTLRLFQSLKFVSFTKFKCKCPPSL